MGDHLHIVWLRFLNTSLADYPPVGTDRVGISNPHLWHGTCVWLRRKMGNPPFTFTMKIRALTMEPARCNG